VGSGIALVVGDTAEVQLLCPSADELLAIGAIAPTDLTVDLIDLEGIGADAFPPARIQIRQLTHQLLAPEEAAERLKSVQSPRVDRRPCHALEIREDLLDELINGYGG